MKTITARFGTPRTAASGENPTYTLALAVQEAFEVLTNPPLIKEKAGWHTGDPKPGAFGSWCEENGVDHGKALDLLKRLYAGEINP